MPRKKKSKVDIIAAYVAENPDATWSTAESVLASKGISGSYFASQRSKLKTSGGESAVAVAEPDLAGSGVVRADKAKPGKRGRKPKSAAVSSSNLGLADAVEFARKAGGIDKAQALLSDLARVQL